MNPFKPSFGVSPPLLVGRSRLLEDFSAALEDGPGAPGRATLYTGARGTGKTVMLNEVESLARHRGWLAISETATPGFLDRLTTEHLPYLLRDQDPEGTATSLTSVTLPLGLGGASFGSEETHRPEMGLRNQLTRLCDLLEPNGAGLLLTLDEVHRHQLGELRNLAATIQHLFREEREVAFVGAGLASSVSSVLNDEVLTFLRRADHHVLGPVPLADVARALVGPIEAEGRSIGNEDAMRAAQATNGYPFLIQLVGYHVWRRSPDVPRISSEDVSQGILAAHRRLGSLVHEPTIAGLSDIDRTFLLAMAQDDGPSAMGEIAERLQVDANYAGQYRLRLIDADLIHSAGHGRVEFAVPYLRDYLREHVALDAQRQAPVPRQPRGGNHPRD